MFKNSLILVLCLFLTLFYTSNNLAQDGDLEYECCCREIQCCYKYFVLFPPALVTPDPPCAQPINKCWNGGDNPILVAVCEGQNFVKWVCEQYKPTGLMVQEGVVLLGFWMTYGSEGLCEVEIKCPVDELGADEAGLGILRSFRDEVLSKNEKGRKLIDIYYKHGNDLIKAFNENPVLKEFAKELLEKTIKRLNTTLGSEEELLSEEIADDIEVLAEELNAVVENPEFKKTLKQIKQDVNSRTLWR